MSAEKWRELFTRINFATRAGKLAWKETPNDNAFITQIGGSIITFKLVEGGSPRNEDLYVVELSDRRGKVVDSFSDEDIGQDSPITLPKCGN